MIWKDNSFQRYAAFRFNEQYPEREYVPREALARNFLYRRLGITLYSKLVDMDKAVLVNFNILMKNYSKWLGIAT